jgi:hypothetical protein
MSQMGSRAIDSTLIDALTAAFRMDQGNVTKAARDAGCTFRTAQRAWERGWPQKGFKPIKTIMVEEQLEIRARTAIEVAARAASKEKDLEMARANAVQSRVQEGQIVALARTASLQAATVSSQLLAGARKLAAVVQKSLEAEVAKQNDPASDPLDHMSVGQTIQLLSRVVDIAAKINGSAYQVMQMERLHLGQPTDIIAHIDRDDEEMTLEDAEARVKAAQQAIDSAKPRLTVIEGGAQGQAISHV